MEYVRTIIRGPSLHKDRGYAWIVLLMSFLSRSASLGFTVAILGNLTVAHQYHLGISVQQSSTLCSVHSGLSCLLGPVASVLTKKMGCRITMIGGGAGLILGFGMLSISTKLSHVYVLFGIIAALGRTAAIVSGSEILALHFDRNKYLAFSLTNLGYYVGTAVWPSISQKLLDEFGYSKAMGIMSTLHVIRIVTGITFYQPREITTPAQDDSVSGGDREAKDVIKNIETKAEDSTHENLMKITRSNPDHTMCQHEKEKRNKDGLAHALKLLLSKANIWVLLASGCLWNLCSMTFLILINDYLLKATEISAEAASFGITIIGLAQIVGCLGVIATSSLDFDRLSLHAAVILLHGVSTIILGFVKIKVTYYVLAALWGSSKGALIANLLAVAYDFCGAEQLALLFGLHLCAEGIGSLVGAPLCGACGVLGGLIIIPIIISKARKAHESEKMTLKAIVIGTMKGVSEQQSVIEKIKDAAGQEYPHLHHL